MDLNLKHKYGKERQPKPFRETLERATQYVDELIQQLIDIHTKEE